jgi:bacillithiol system protein YtxJ
MIHELRRKEDFEALVERSKTDPILVFKHSTQCGLSERAFDAFQNFMRHATGVEAGVVDVLEHRDVSNVISEQLGIEHESPQAIVIHGGQPSWNASHRAITETALRQALGMRS